MSDKIYADGLFLKSVKTQYGIIIKANIKVSEFTNFLKQHVNENDFVSIDILERKEPSDKGHTHYSVLNQFKPTKSENKENNVELSNTSNTVQENDDLPF